MSVKNVLFLLVLLFSNNNFYGQNIIKPYDCKYYLLGTLGDYLGFCKVLDDSTVITVLEDDFYKIYLIDSLLSYSNKNDADIVKYSIVKYGRRKHFNQASYELISNDLNKYIWSFYRFRKLNYLTDEGEKIYLGKLKYNKLRKSTDEQIMSFLAGVYFYFGYTKESQYYIKMPNSLSKMAVIKKLLKKYDCKKVKYTINKKGKPYIHLITFIPSDKLKLIFDHVKEVEWNLNFRKYTLTQQ